MSLRRRAGALLYDWPRFALQLRRGRWARVHNRDEAITSDGRGVRCEWRYATDLHIAKVFPWAGERLMGAALRDWPIVESDDAPAASEHPEISFVIGHRGLQRLPHLLRTLRSIAGQTGAAIECIVVEQSVSPEIERALPHWVRYIHTSVPSLAFEYARSWAFNVGARIARAPLLVLHDNDMLVPERYASEAVAVAREGWSFIDLKRFVFYLDAQGALASVAQNLEGGSVIASRAAYFDIGGFDESFVGWGGEDNEFRERADAHSGFYRFGCVPMLHLFHEPQQGKVDAEAAPAVARYHELRRIPAAERIARLRGREIGRADVPPQT